ncbi:MAG TPA: patatin-like phospholipase family protein [Bacillota bacterium]
MPKADAVFEGGGVKGVGLVGAVVEAEARGYEWVNLAGTSAGAILAALLAAGYSGDQIWRILRDLDYRHFCDRDWLDRIPLLGPAASLLFECGLYEGRYLETWLTELLAARGVCCFGDLRLPEYEADPRYRYRLRVIASDLTHGRLLVLPQDAVRLGLDPDRLRVARAVRMSMSIPFFFEPVVLRGRDGERIVIVDGGVLSNFPVWLFDCDGVPPWPTFGFKIVEPGEGRPRRIRGPVTMLAALVATMLEAHDARYIEDADFVRTIAVPSLGVATTDFDLTRQRAQELFEAGRTAAREFFDGWDFASYIEQYRSAGTAGSAGRRGGRRRRLRGA